MKAKETVIKGGVRQELKIHFSNTITGHLLGWQPVLEHGAQEKVDTFIEGVRLEQAEISFPLGKQEGIREVVEWVSQHIELVIFPDNKFYDAWQAKLKEWEVKNG